MKKNKISREWRFISAGTISEWWRTNVDPDAGDLWKRDSGPLYVFSRKQNRAPDFGSSMWDIYNGMRPDTFFIVTPRKRVDYADIAFGSEYFR